MGSGKNKRGPPCHSPYHTAIAIVPTSKTFCPEVFASLAFSVAHNSFFHCKSSCTCRIYPTMGLVNLIALFSGASLFIIIDQVEASGMSLKTSPSYTEQETAKALAINATEEKNYLKVLHVLIYCMLLPQSCFSDDPLSIASPE